MSFWVIVPGHTVRTAPGGESVILYSVEVGVQSLTGEKCRRTVLRRYSDFRTLALQLRNELADKVLPPVPAKNRLARVNEKETLVDERRKALESWLWELLQDVSLAHSKALGTFLELQAARKGLTQPAKLPGDAAEPADDGNDSPRLSSREAEHEFDGGAAHTSPVSAPPPLRTDERAKLHLSFTALQQRFAATKSDLTDALTCLRSDAAVKKLLSDRCDELEARILELTAGGGAGGGSAAAAAAPGEQRAASTQPGDVDERITDLQWRLEEALAEHRAAQQVSWEQAARADEALAENARLRSLLQASETATAEAQTLAQAAAQEVQSVTRERDAAIAACEEAEAATTAVAANAASASLASVQSRLKACLREADTLRQRLSDDSLTDGRAAALVAESQLLGRVDSATSEIDHRLTTD